MGQVSRDADVIEKVRLHGCISGIVVVEAQKLVTVRFPCVLGRRMFAVGFGRTADGRPGPLVMM